MQKTLADRWADYLAGLSNDMPDLLDGVIKVRYPKGYKPSKINVKFIEDGVVVDRGVFYDQIQDQPLEELIRFTDDGLVDISDEEN